MENLYSHARILFVALTLLYGGFVAPPTAQAAGPGGFAANFIGRFYFDPNHLQGFVAGYLPDIAGIPGPFFNGSPPGEGTAFFTFRSDVFQFTQLAPNGDLLPFVLAAGTNQLAIYFNAQPSGDFTNPDTFSSGQLIATLQSPDALLLQFFSEDPTSTLPFVIRAIPVSRKTFTFNGTTVDFSTVAPGGLTLFNTVSTTQLPGTGIKTATNDFTLIFPFAGSGIAVGPTNAAGNPSPAAPVASWNRVVNVTQPSLP
jgi:hypothetical protein